MWGYRAWTRSRIASHLAYCTCTRVFAGHSGPIVSVECTDARVISTSFDGTCRVWDWSGRQLLSIEAHDGHASGLALPEGDARKVLTGGDDGRVKQFDLETGTCVTSCDGHDGAVWCVRTHGPLVLTGATDGSLRAWDLRAGCGALAAERHAHDDALAGLQLDERKALTASCA